MLGAEANSRNLLLFRISELRSYQHICKMRSTMLKNDNNRGDTEMKKICIRLL